MTTCGTTIQYGEIAVRNVLTNYVDLQPVMDSTGVDPIGVKTTISFIGILHTSGSPGSVPRYGNKVNWSLPPGEGLGPGINALVQDFLIPRQRFRMWMGTDPVFDILPGAVESCGKQNQANQSYAYQEIAHGPHTSCKIISVQGLHSAKCQFEVTFTTVLQCGTGNLGDWLNLRYWVADDIDCKEWLTRRTYSGRFRVRNRNVNPHVLARQITLPPLQNGFRRDSISWHEDPNGLELAFTIVDVEQYAQAPWPATHWEGSYAVIFPYGGINVETDLSFRLWADPQVPKASLFNLAQRIIDSKTHYQEMKITNGGDKGSLFVVSSHWQENLARNEVNVSLRLRLLGGLNGAIQLMNLPDNQLACGLADPLSSDVSQFDVTGLGTGPPHDPHIARLPVLPDTLGGLFVSALSNPCCPQSLSGVDKLAYPVDTVLERDEPKYYRNESSYLTVSTDDDHYSTSHRQRMYQWYRISSKYHGDTGWRGFPSGEQCSRTRPSFRFSQIHCPVMTREVRLEACRIDEWPEIPLPQHSWTDYHGNQYILKDFDIEPGHVQLGADGRNKLCEVSARYFYYMANVPNLADDGRLAVGVLPYTKPDQVQQGNWAVADLSRVGADYFKNPASILDSQSS